MTWPFNIHPGDPHYINNPTPVSLPRFPMRGNRPGNCLVSIAVTHNILRNHFENEIYMLGLKRYIHVHLLFEQKDGKINFLDEVIPGKNQSLFFKRKIPLLISSFSRLPF